ncbi:MAG: class I SAM-dependent methyltransferase [Candidatus Bathyarchaeia archaeon]|uniref:class I SAM-dependent methyltransferase n=1 Tax=Candidatus Hadarchaeum sp. TaxID=2883567 RepID=UPI003176E744
MNRLGRLYKNWHKALEELSKSHWRRYISPAIYAQYDVAVKLMREYVYGNLIDLGCGDMPFKEFLLDLVDNYDSLDLWPHSTEVTYVGDIQDMSMIGPCSYDSVICLEVLEHVPNPQQAIREIHRILKPSGVFIVSVPHLSRIHNIPHDYFRFTLYGLATLLHSAGFDIVDIRVKGGIFSFLGHQISIFILGSCWGTPVLRKIALILVKYCLTIPCYKLDQWLDFGGIFALGYVAVARK